MLSIQHITLLACCLLSVESVILGRRRSSQSSWSWNNWGNNRRNSWAESEKYRWETPKNEGWGWNWNNQDYWGSGHNIDSYSSSGQWNSNSWNSRNSQNSWNSGTSRWNHLRKRQRSRRRNHSRTHTRTTARATSRARASSTHNAWFYQMLCKNSYEPLKQADGSPYYCSWYSPCPQNGGSSYWYTYKYTCKKTSEGTLGLCCVDAGEMEFNNNGWK